MSVPRNKKGIITIAVLCLVLCFAAVCTVILTGKKNTDKTNKRSDGNVTVSADSEYVTETVIDIPPVNVLTDGISVSTVPYSDSYIYNGVAVIGRTVNCPVILSDKISTDIINSTLAGYCSDFVAISSSAKLEAEDAFDTAERTGFDFDPIEKNADYSCYCHDGVMSVVFDIASTAGAIEETFSTDAFCFDLESQSRLSLEELLDMYGKYSVADVKDAFIKMIGEAPENFYSDAKELIEYELGMYDFYLSDAGITVYIPAYAIAPGAFGTQSVTFEY